MAFVGLAGKRGTVEFDNPVRKTPQHSPFRTVFLTVVKCMLETSDYNVLLASSAEVALRMTERTDLTIDLMLIDVVMPDLSGPDLVERVLGHGYRK